MKIRLLTGAVSCAFFFSINPSLLAQGSLTPPAPPAPTMKTLDQVEARTPIDAIHTPGDVSNDFIISQSGSYYLTGNFTGAAAKQGIRVTASHGIEPGGLGNQVGSWSYGPSRIRVDLRRGNGPQARNYMRIDMPRGARLADALWRTGTAYYVPDGCVEISSLVDEAPSPAKEYSPAPAEAYSSRNDVSGGANQHFLATD